MPRPLVATIQPVRYEIKDGERMIMWEVILFEGLQRRFILEDTELPDFHRVASGVTDLWNSIIRPYYGIRPIDPVAGDMIVSKKITGNFERLRLMNGMSIAQMNEALKRMVGIWAINRQNQRRSLKFGKLTGTERAEIKASIEKAEQSASTTVQVQSLNPTPQTLPGANGEQPAASKPVPAPSNGVMLPGDELQSEIIRQLAQGKLPQAVQAVEDCYAVAKYFGFSRSVFDVKSRSQADEFDEVRWFANRCLELRRLFEEPTVRDLLHFAMMNVIYMNRCDAEMTSRSPGSEVFKDLQQQKTVFETTYSKQWEKIEEICPYVRQIQSRNMVQAVLSDFVEGYRKWKQTGESKKLIELYDNYGIQVDTQMSIQVPIPNFRMGWAMCVQEAMAGLYDPNFKRTIPLHVAKICDEAVKIASERIRNRESLPLPDLEGEGPSSEFAPLVPANPDDLEITDPAKTATIDLDANGQPLPSEASELEQAGDVEAMPMVPLENVS